MIRRARQRSRLHLYATIIALAGSTLALGIGSALPEPDAPVNDYGYPVPTLAASIAPDAPIVQEFAGCKLARFGTAPWAHRFEPWHENRIRASEQAFRLMGLPRSTAQAAVDLVRANRPTEFVLIGNQGGRSLSGETFGRKFATSYRGTNGYAVCHDSSTNFRDSWQEETCVAWRLVGADGTEYWVGYCPACNNLARFFPGEATPEVRRMVEVNEVPEPSSVWLVGLGLVGIIFSRRTS